MGPGAGPVGEQFAFHFHFKNSCTTVILSKHLLDRQNIGVRFVSAEPPL